jgi:hypothetical protein
MDIYMKCGHLLMNKWALQNRKDVQKGKAPKCLITHENERERDRELAGTMINAHLSLSHEDGKEVKEIIGRNST